MHHIPIQVPLRSSEVEAEPAAVLLPQVEGQAEDMEGAGVVDQAGQEVRPEVLQQGQGVPGHQSDDHWGGALWSQDSYRGPAAGGKGGGCGEEGQILKE